MLIMAIVVLLSGASLRRAVTVLAVLFALGLVPLAVAAMGSSNAAHFSSGCREGKMMALTFDDGPDPALTQQVVDILRYRGAKATFFVRGVPAEAHPEIVAAIRAAGMEVGLHSYSHAQDLAKWDADAFWADLDEVRTVVEDAAGGERMTLYRAPYGRTSEMMLRQLGEAGLTSIGWDVNSGDWKGNASADDIALMVLAKAHAGAIVLMHDGSAEGAFAHTATVEALPQIIDGLRQEGYRLVTVSELLGLDSEDGASGGGCSSR